MRIPLVSPTPVTLAPNVSRAVGCEVYVKHDDATHPRYGGNKVRKLEYLLADARARGATDLVTVGAVGSHHVLATTVHGRAAGFRVEAVLAPQPSTPHVLENLQADLAQGATLHPVESPHLVPWVMARRALALRGEGRVPYLIPPGGSTPVGALGYVDAVGELTQQLSAQGLPTPDVMVCALGSGATQAGLIAGARLHGLRAEVLGVRVTERWMSHRALVSWLATRALSLASPRRGARGRVSLGDVTVDDDQLGEGYGRAMPAAREALDLFAEDGISLDLTYTAKAAAGLLSLARRRPGRRYLFWSTLSSAPLGPLVGARAVPVPPSLAALLR